MNSKIFQLAVLVMSVALVGCGSSAPQITNAEKADIKGSKPPANIDIGQKMAETKAAYDKAHPAQAASGQPSSPMGPASAQGK